MSEGKWTFLNTLQIAAPVVTLLALGAGGGVLLTKVDALERNAVQSALDSRTLIEVKQDVAYIKDAVKAFQTIASATYPISCPSDSPVRVAAYCRALPEFASMDREE